MKNVVDPKYAQMLKQQQNRTQHQHHHLQQNQLQQPQNQHQHIIQQKVLLADPKTGKMIYLMKNVVDPRYA